MVNDKPDNKNVFLYSFVYFCLRFSLYYSIERKKKLESFKKKTEFRKHTFAFHFHFWQIQFFHCIWIDLQNAN